MASAKRVRAAGGVPEPMAAGAMPRERGSAAAFFFRLGLPSLLFGARLAVLGSAMSNLESVADRVAQYIWWGIYEARLTAVACSPPGAAGQRRGVLQGTIRE